MAEDTQGFASKKLLIAAVALGVIAVVLYNVQINRVREASRGETVTLLRVTRDLRPGDRITERDIQRVEMDTEFVEGLGNVLKSSDAEYALQSTVNQPVPRGTWLMYEFTVSLEEAQPSRIVSPGRVGAPITVDPRKTPGELLQPNDRVNIMGLLALPKKPPQTYRILENVKVLAVGGKAYREPTGGESPQFDGMRQYTKLTLDIPQDISQQLANIETYLVGSFWVEVRNPLDYDARQDLQFPQELRNLPARLPGSAAGG
jgi:Flp pilus assembly protein CpaB